MNGPGYWRGVLLRSEGMRSFSRGFGRSLRVVRGVGGCELVMDAISMGDESLADKDGIIYGDLVWSGWKALHYVLWAGGFTVIQV